MTDLERDWVLFGCLFIAGFLITLAIDRARRR
jgi:hypothetical protein